MLQAHKAPKKGDFARPRTAATCTVYDERRIKDKMKYLEGVLDNLDTAVVDDFGLVDIDKFRDIQNPG